MQFTEEAAKKLLNLLEEQKPTETGIRVTAQSLEEGFQLKLFWENKALPEDILMKEEGLEIYIDEESNRILDDTIVYFSVEDGKEGIFIMKTTSDCSSCSTVCF